MPRGRPKKNADPAKKAASNLAEALAFVGVASKAGSQNEWAKFVQLGDGQAIAFDGVLTAGHKISDDLTSAPNLDLLLRALERTGASVQITQIDAHKLSVTSGKFRAVVPCIDLADLPDHVPDANIAPIDDRIKQGFERIGHVVKEAGTTVAEASLLLQNGSMVATDRVILMEFWHGNSLPPVGLVVPKTFVSAVAATKKKLVGFGWTEGKSITFHFEDESWIKTQLFTVDWPRYEQIFQPSNPQNCYPVPDGFYDAIENVLPFSEDGYVYFTPEACRSHDSLQEGASFEVRGVTSQSAFAGKRLLLLKGRADMIEFHEGSKAAYFYSNDPPIRGALAYRGRNPNPAVVNGDVDIPVPPQFQPEPPRQEPPEPPASPLEAFPAAASAGTGWTAGGAQGSYPASPAGGLPHPGMSPDPYDDTDPADDGEEYAPPVEQAFQPFQPGQPVTGYPGFNLDAHNQAAYANQQAADPYAKQYPGVPATLEEQKRAAHIAAKQDRKEPDPFAKQYPGINGNPEPPQSDDNGWTTPAVRKGVPVPE